MGARGLTVRGTQSAVDTPRHMGVRATTPSPQSFTAQSRPAPPEDLTVTHVGALKVIRLMRELEPAIDGDFEALHR